MRIVVTALIIILSVMMVVFGAQNTAPVNVRFLAFETGATSLSLVIVLSAVGGALIVGLFALLDSARRGMRFRRVNKERTSLDSQRQELELKLANLEQELAALRAPATAQAREAGGAPSQPASVGERRG